MSPNSYHRRIVTDGEILSESYVPNILHAREYQVRELISWLSPTHQTNRPLHIWLYGPPGSGKTCVASYVLIELNQRFTLRHVYVNCWNHPTLYRILDKVAQELRLLGTEVQSTSVKLDTFRKAVGGKRFILVLDEIDRITPKERNAILYSLSSIEGLGLVCIADSRYSFHILEDRVKSRLNPKLVEFKPYTTRDLATICRFRAEIALDPDAWTAKTICDISQLAGGDARCAIQTLFIASRNAEKDGDRLILQKHVKEGCCQAHELTRVYALSTLTDHHRLLYQLVETKEEVLSGELWQLYLKKCKSKGIKPIAVRTFSDYMNRLKREGLITGKRAQLRGRVRMFKIKKQRRI